MLLALELGNENDKNTYTYIEGGTLANSEGEAEHFRQENNWHSCAVPHMEKMRGRFEHKLHDGGCFTSSAVLNICLHIWLLLS